MKGDVSEVGFQAAARIKLGVLMATPGDEAPQAFCCREVGDNRPTNSKRGILFFRVINGRIRFWGRM